MAYSFEGYLDNIRESVNEITLMYIGKGGGLFPREVHRG